MRNSKGSRTRTRRILACVFHRFIVAGLLLAVLPSIATTAQPVKKPAPPVKIIAPPVKGSPIASKEWVKWQKLMSRKPLPQVGCYTVTYPKTEWVTTKCSLAPPYPLTVGNGSDSVAQVSSGAIGSAVGSFGPISGLTSENDSGNSFTFGGTNDFSLQVNTNTFATTTANGVQQNGNTSTNPCAASSPGCKGWEQFVLTNFASVSPVGTNMYMQFWLLGYLGNFKSCPSSQIPGGWESGLLGQWRQSGNDCYINGPAVGVPIQNITNLSQLVMTATVNLGGQDVATVSTPSQMFSIGLPANFLGMNQSWTQAEFNVFGLWNASEANFNAGTTITVNNALTDQGGNAVVASCGGAGTTGETNNLNFSPCQCFSSGSQIIFTESNAPSPTCACPSGSTWSQGASSCACNVPGQVMNGATGQCACAISGETVQNNQCACSASGAVPINGSCGCSVPGQAIQNNACTCTVAGAAVINGACSCFDGQSVVNNACVCPAGTRWNANTLKCVCTKPGEVLVNGRCEIPKNACGGTTKLSGVVGASCSQATCGKLRCDGLNALECESSTNVCGGCAAFPTIPGAGPQPGQNCTCSNGKAGRFYCTTAKQLSCDCAP